MLISPLFSSPSRAAPDERGDGCGGRRGGFLPGLRFRRPPDPLLRLLVLPPTSPPTTSAWPWPRFGPTVLRQSLYGSADDGFGRVDSAESTAFGERIGGEFVPATRAEQPIRSIATGKAETDDERRWGTGTTKCEDKLEYIGGQKDTEVQSRDWSIG